MASASLNEENVEKRLMSVSNTQDSIQSLSLWIIHHKTHHARIVELWYKIIKKSAKPSHRLTLFYLCNDVVQNCKRKKALVFIETFKPLIKQATALVRDASIKGKVERIFNIWEERQVYDKDFVAKLKAILDGKRSEHGKRDSATFKKPFSPKDQLKEKAKEKMKEKIKEQTVSPLNEDLDDIQPADASLDPEKEEEKDKDADAPSEETLAVFKPSEMIEKIKIFKYQEAEMEIKVRQLSHLKLDASSIEAIKQLKDRAHGNEFSTQFEESCLRLEEAMKCLDKKKGEQKDLLDQLVISEYFYNQQFREAKIVVNAYKNYGSRINTMKRKLDELIRTLPSLTPSPTPDAPSPENTPPEEEAVEAVDMEVDQDNSLLSAEVCSGGVGVALTTTTRSILKPIPSIKELIFGDDVIPSPPDEAPSPVGSSPGETSTHDIGSSRLENRLASLLPSLQPITNSMPVVTEEECPIPVYVPQPLNSNSNSATRRPSANKTLTEPEVPFQEEEDETGGSTPLTDEQPSTPVLDEEEPIAVPSPPPPPPPPLEKKKENPIDFLSRLISQTQKNKMEGSMTSNSSFLESFTRLTSKVKEHIDLKKSGTDDENSNSGSNSPGPKSWAAWKAEKAAGEGEPPGLTIPPPPVPNFGLPPPQPSSVRLPVPPPSGVPAPLPVPPPSLTSPTSSFFQHISPGQKENWPQVGEEGRRESGDDVLSPNIVYHSVQDEMTSPPYPPVSSKLVMPVKGILRKNSNSVLKELTPSSDDPSTPESLPPPPPPPPPLSDYRPSMQMSPLGEMNPISTLGSASNSEAQEFMEKLKRKTSGNSTPPTYTPNPIFPNLMTLTPGGEMDMDLDEEDEEEEDDEDKDELTRIPVLSSVVRRVDPEEQRQIREKEMQHLKDRDLDRHNKHEQESHDSSSPERIETFREERRFSGEGDEDNYYSACSSASSSDYSFRDNPTYNFGRPQQQQQQQQQQLQQHHQQQQQQQSHPQPQRQPRPLMFPHFSPNNMGMRNMSPNLLDMFRQRMFGPNSFPRPQPNRPFPMPGLHRGINQRGFQF